MLTVSVIATAQAQISWGVKGGFNLLALDVNAGRSNLQSENLTGFQLGPMINFTVPLAGINLDMDAALLYSHNGYKFDGIEFSQGSFFIPVNVKYKLSFLGIAGAYAAAGPYINLKIVDNANKNEILVESIKSKSFGAGLNLGVGMEFLSHFQAGINYQLGLINEYELLNSVKNTNGKNKGWVLSAAYLF
jgi:hypothetical protein